MSIKIYKDSSANSIFIEDANGAQFLNSLQASTTAESKVFITDLAKQIEIVSDEDHTQFIDENGDQYPGSATDVCNELNALFQTAGTPNSELPTITSPLTISSVEGDVINYELIANYGVGYEWDFSNVSGIVNVSGSSTKIIGGSSLLSGVYNIPVRAINYNGEDAETIVLTVSNPPFSNTKSVRFQSNDYLDNESVSSMASTLGRIGNGSGASDAWTISFYLKSGTHTGGGKQTVFYYGDSDHDNGGHIWIYYKGSEQAVYLEYGSKNNYIRLKSADNVLNQSFWSNLIFTYDGGTTGSSSGDINDYYSRFKLWLFGFEVPVLNSNGNFGWSSGVDSDLLRVGRRAGGNDYMRNSTKVDEVAVWASDESLNISSIYNNGVPFDLSTLATPPSNWWRMGDGDTYPILQDSISTIDLEMNGMTSADIVNDVP